MAAPVANAGVDAEYAYSSLPVASHQLSGSATGGSGTYTAWQWYLLDKPDGSAAALDDATLQNPKLQNVDAAGTYLLFLVVTDDASAKSETQRQLAPNSAFVHVRVTTQYAALKRPASGERDYSRQVHALIDQVDATVHDLDAQVIADHDTVATGAQLDTLVGGGNADALHTHGAAGIAVATTTAQGVVLLAEAPQNVAAPKVATKNRVYFTGKADGSMTGDGWSPGTIEKQFSGNYSMCHLHWKIPEAMTLEDAYFTFADGGPAGGGYVVSLYELTEAEFKANDFASAIAAGRHIGQFPVTQGSTDNAPLVVGASGAGHALSAGNILAVLIDASPTPPGGGLSASIRCVLEW